MVPNVLGSHPNQDRKNVRSQKSSTQCARQEKRSRASILYVIISHLLSFILPTILTYSHTWSPCE